MDMLKFRELLLPMPARMAGDCFSKPDDDWAAMLFLQGVQTGKLLDAEVPEDATSATLHVVDCSTAPSRDAIDAMVTLAIQTTYCDNAAVLSSAWTLPKEVVEVAMKQKGLPQSGSWRDATYEDVGLSQAPRDHPARIEILTFAGANREDQRLWLSTARIDRHEDSPPTLRDWVHEEPQPFDNCAGTRMLALCDGFSSAS